MEYEIVFEDEEVGKRICVKVDYLRSIGYGSLKHWVEDSFNVYAGRRGRIFITDKETKEKTLFHYSESFFANPFKVEKDGVKDLDDCLEKYEEYIRKKKGLEMELESIKGKNIGCFCDLKNKCHVDIILKLLQEKS